MRNRKWLMGLILVLALPVSAFVALATAGAEPAADAAVTAEMTGVVSGSTITYSITVTNNTASEIGNLYITGSIPEGAKFSEATATPAGATFKAVEDGAAAWVSDSIAAGATQGPFTYTVSVTEAPAGPAHAWVHWLTPSDGIAVSGDVTWDMATSAGAPRRGCLACHTGSHSLPEEAHSRATVDYGMEHPDIAPDGTSIKETDQVGPDVCLECHAPAPGNPERGVGAPITLRDIVHPAHMFSAHFKENYGGNCFTCHNVRGDGTFELLGSKVNANEKGVPKDLLAGKGAIPGSILPSEGGK